MKLSIAFFAAVALLFLFVETSQAATSLDVATCRQYGFDADTLLCGVCSKLEEIVGTKSHCLDCCHSPFDKVKLTATQTVLMRSAGLNEFLQDRKKKFGPKLVTFEMKLSADEEARLILSNTQTKDERTIRVTHWQANDLEDYLAQYFPRVI